MLKEAERLRPDVIVCDISMPLLNGIEAVRQIKKSDHQVKVVILTMHPDVSFAALAFETPDRFFRQDENCPSSFETIRIHSVKKGSRIK